MGNIICENYYCHSVSYKPEWLSESSWVINYDSDKKPYEIDKGILKIIDIPSIKLLITKKLLINFNDISLINIPSQFNFNIDDNNELNINFILSDKLLTLDTFNKNILSISLKIKNKKIYITRSFNNIIIKKKIDIDTLNNFSINIENNNLLKMLMISEKLNNIYEEKYLKQSLFEDKDLYLSLYIFSNNHIKYFELNFE